MVEVFSEIYRQVTIDDNVLWRGDLIVLDRPIGDDCRVYMLASSILGSELSLINFVGYKAGNTLVSAIFPNEASEPGAKNVKLLWLKENWDSVIGLGTFETSKFYKWNGTKS